MLRLNWKQKNGGGVWTIGFHFGSKKNTKISIVFEDLSGNSVFFQTEVKHEYIEINARDFKTKMQTLKYIHISMHSHGHA